MKDLYKVIRTAAAEVGEVIVFFSTGKDSIATLDLCARFIPIVHAVHLYSVPGLGYRERFLRYYEERYGITIDQYPLPDTAALFKNNTFINSTREVTKLSQGDIELAMRKKYDVSYIAFGYRKNESLQRRGQLSVCDGFERKFKRLFPLSDWNERDVMNYLKKQKLPLPPEYSVGFRDINFFEGPSLVWLYNNYPEDYQKVKRMYPMIEAELIRAYDISS